MNTKAKAAMTDLNSLWRLSLPMWLVLAGIFSSACSYNVDSTPTYEDAGVARLYDYPTNRQYTNLGTHAWGFYRIGFAEPDLADVWDSLSEKVLALGGNACIVRHEKVGKLSARTLEVTCEVLKVGSV